MFLFIPVIFGCPTKVKPQGQQRLLRPCPHCRNQAVFPARKTTWFELFWIPLIPLSRQYVWLCRICQWNEPTTKQQIRAAEEETKPPPPFTATPPPYVAPNAPGYQPVYIGQEAPATNKVLAPPA